MRLLARCTASSCVILYCASILSAQDGEALYKRACATCHESGAERVPSRETLKAVTPERVLATMESGAMIAMASRLSAAERRAVAEFVTGKSLGRASATVPSPQAMCAEARGVSDDLMSGPQWSGWGPAIGGGMLFVNSGYVIWGGMPGNVLLAFSVDRK